MRDQHFTQVRELIDREMFLVAERLMAEFDSTSYPDPAMYRKGLDFYFAKMIAETAPAYMDVPKFRESAKRLEESLQANRASLPEPVKALFGAGIQRLANVLLRRFYPNAPPTAIKLNPADVKSYQERIRSLIELTETALSEKKGEIEAYKAEEERSRSEELANDQAAQMAILQKATLLRDAYLDIFLTAYTPLREIIQRGELYGIEETFIDQEVRPWVNAFLSNGEDEFGEWAWAYGSYYIFLQHKVKYLTAVAKASKAKDDSELKWVLEDFYEVLNSDMSHLPDRAQKFVSQWKITAWRDLFCWLQEVPSKAWVKENMPEIQEKLEAWMDERNFSLNSRRAVIRDNVAQVFFQAAHVADAIGDTGLRDTFMIEVQNSRSAFKENAGKMLGYFASRGSDGGSGGWLDPVRPADAERALTTARAFVVQAGQALDPEVSRRFFTNAAVNLRNGLADLPANTKDKRFVALAPDLAYFYVYALYKLEWYDLALATGMQWLTTFEPQRWGSKPAADNPYFKNGQVTEGGLRVRSLASLVMASGQKMSSITDSAAVKKLFGEAIELLGQFDPEAVEGNSEKMQVVLLLQQESWDEADRQASDYGKKMNAEAKKLSKQKKKSEAFAARKEQFWALRMATTARYSKWKAGWDVLSPDRLNEAAEQMNAYAQVLIPVSQRVLDDENSPADLQTEARKAWNLGVSINVARLFRDQDYLGVINFLDEDFWANAPRDDLVNVQLMNWLTNAAGLLATAMTDDLKAGLEGAKRLRGEAAQQAVADAYAKYAFSVLEQEKALSQVVKQFRYLTNAQPALEEALINARLQLVKLTQVIDLYFSRMLKKSADDLVWPALLLLAQESPMFAELESAPQDYVTRVRDEAKSLFADVYAPLMNEETPAKNIYAVADALQAGGQEARAAEKYELFLRVQGKDRELIDFMADPRPMLKEIADIAAPGDRFGLAGPFDVAFVPEAKGKEQANWEAATFADFLYDSDEFREAMVQRKDIEKLGIRNEKGRNYAAAIQALRIYRTKLFNKQRVALGQNFAAGEAALKRLEKIIQSAYLRYLVMERLLEYYRDGEEPQKAIPLARELYAYNPRSRKYQSAMVDTVLVSFRMNGDVGGDMQAQLEEARQVAVGMRESLSDGQDSVALWNARVQVYELSIALGEGDKVGDRELKRHMNARRFPWFECFEVFDEALALGIPGQTWLAPEQVPWQLLHDGQGVTFDEKNGETVVLGRLSRRAVAVCRRYLALYETLGIPQPAIDELTLQQNEIGQAVTVHQFKSKAGG
jgi:hypothetical protein